jgi:3-oxoacyl-[acyl-carrier-protein] synthase-3
LSSWLRSDGEGLDLITIPGLSISDEDLSRRGGKHERTVWMDGAKVMKFASRAMVSSIEEVVRKAGHEVSDVRLVIPHQANLRIIENAAKRLNLEPERLFVNVQRYGNTSSASVMIALAEACEEGRLPDGGLCVLVGFGAGLTYGAVALRWRAVHGLSE